MTPDPDATPTTERAAPLADDTPARRSDPNTLTTPRRTRRPYRHSRPVFDRPVRIHSEYARRLVSERQFRPAMTALYGLDVILRLIATAAEADQVETVIATRLSALSQELVRERLHAELECYAWPVRNRVWPWPSPSAPRPSSPSSWCRGWCATCSTACA